MPLPVAKVHERFKGEFFAQLSDEDTSPDFDYAVVWECDSGDEVDDKCQLHPWLTEENPDFLTQFLMDKKTTRWYYVAIGLWDRIGIGDIDDEGNIIVGDYEKTPVMFFSEVTETWAKFKIQTKKKAADAAINKGALGGIKDDALTAIMEKRAKILEHEIKKRS
jgi:hypothetical protein